MSGDLGANVAVHGPSDPDRSVHRCATTRHALPGRRTGQVDVSIVIPTVGRASLGATLRSLVEAVPDERLNLHLVLLVDDRGPGDQHDPLHPPPSTEELRGIANAWLGDVDTEVAITRSGGRCPVGARNLGIAQTTTPWVVVLDDDVTVSEQWWHALADDLVQAEPDVGGVFAHLDVRVPDQRWSIGAETRTGRLVTEPWVSADVALRRTAFEEIGGLVEDPDRASDDLALRLRGAGWRPSIGSRRSLHPPRPRHGS